ncbi:MAG: hypothetical protein ACLGI3_15030 [Actinomycetes bacterium]
MHLPQLGEAVHELTRHVVDGWCHADAQARLLIPGLTRSTAGEETGSQERIFDRVDRQVHGAQASRRLRPRGTEGTRLSITAAGEGGSVPPASRAKNAAGNSASVRTRRIREVVRDVLGYDDFRPGQEAAM